MEIVAFAVCFVYWLGSLVIVLTCLGRCLRRRFVRETVIALVILGLVVARVFLISPRHLEQWFAILGRHGMTLVDFLTLIGAVAIYLYLLEWAPLLLMAPVVLLFRGRPALPVCAEEYGPARLRSFRHPVNWRQWAVVILGGVLAGIVVCGGPRLASGGSFTTRFLAMFVSLGLACAIGAASMRAATLLARRGAHGEDTNQDDSEPD